MDIWTAFRETDEGEPTYLGAAKTPEGAKARCEAIEAADAAHRTRIGETTINADRSVTRVPRTFTSHLVWAEEENGDFITTNASVFAFEHPFPDHYLVRREPLLD